MVETGVIHGRFQILHLKHMEYLLAAKMRCKVLYIGITHPDTANRASDPIHDLNGTECKDNPLTYIERYEMIRDALLDFGVGRDEFEIIPFPINNPEVLPQYIPEKATHYMSICGEWDREKYRILTDLGQQVEILWERLEDEKGITGTKVREMIALDEEWQPHVPKTAVEYIYGHGIDTRIAELYSDENQKDEDAEKDKSAP